MPHATSAPLDLYPPVSHDPRWWWVVAGCLVVAAGVAWGCRRVLAAIDSAAAGDDFVADVFTAIARETLDGRNAHTTDGVERALGRKPRDFAAFATAAASRGVWNAAA